MKQTDGGCDKCVLALHGHIFKNRGRDRLDSTAFKSHTLTNSPDSWKTGGGYEERVLALDGHILKSRVRKRLGWSTFWNTYSDTLSSLMKNRRWMRQTCSRTVRSRFQKMGAGPSRLNNLSKCMQTLTQNPHSWKTAGECDRRVPALYGHVVQNWVRDRLIWTTLSNTYSDTLFPLRTNRWWMRHSAVTF